MEVGAEDIVDVFEFEAEFREAVQPGLLGIVEPGAAVGLVLADAGIDQDGVARAIRSTNVW